MAITREFRIAEDQERGLIGFQPTWFENATPGMGSVCAHDILEHFRHQTSALEGECEAVGSCIFLRLEPGVFGPNSGARTISAEVSTMVRDFLYSEGALKLPTAKPSRPLESHFIEGFLPDGVEQGIATAWEEYVYGLSGDEDEDEVESLRELIHSKATHAGFLYWIRKGYRRAARRYREADACTVGGYLFDKVTQAMDGLLPRASELHGMYFRVSVYPREGRVDIKFRDDFRHPWRDAQDFLM